MARKQRRGCSKLVYASYTFDPLTKTITYGTPKVVAPVKSITRTIDEASEEVWADNELQELNYGGKKITRTFEITPVELDVEADLFALDSVTIAGTEKAYGEKPNGDRPYFAWGYALFDGDESKPCEVVWAFKGRAVSLTNVSNTIQQGNTASEGQTLEVEFVNPDVKFTATGHKNMDITARITTSTTFDWEDWFEQVITYDNIATILG